MQQVWQRPAHPRGPQQPGETDAGWLAAAPMTSRCLSCVAAAQGFVYLKFSSQARAQAAQKALHGRWFAGRQVVAEFQIEGLYRNYFKC